jgi:hypothetical protein
MAERDKQRQSDVTRREPDLDLKQVDEDVKRREQLARQRQDDAQTEEGQTPQTVSGPGVPDAATARAERARAAADQASRSTVPLTTDNATATKTAAIATDVKPAAPFADADPLRPSEVLLPRARVNGVFEGRELTLGTADEPWTGTATAMIFNQFGGPDRDVALRLRVQSRPDATVPWEEANVFELGEIDDAGPVEIPVELIGPSRAVGAVVGSDGGHAVEVELTVSKK